MADDLTLKIPITADVSPISSAMNTMKDKVSGAMSGVRDAMGAVGLMAAGFLTGAINSASKAAEATEQLKTKLENQGVAWDTASKQVDQFTSGVKAMSTHTGGEAKDALNNLITRNVSLTDAMKMQAPMTELAAAKNISLTDASNMLADAENGRWRGLEQLGIVTKEQVKDGISMTDVLAKINDKYKGLSEGQMQTLPGQIALVSRNFNDFKVGIGTALLPVITMVATALEKITEKLKTITPEQKEIIAVVLAVVAVLGTLAGGVGIVTKVMGILGPVVTGLGGLIGGLTLPIVAVIAGIAAFTLAYTTNFGGFKTFIDEIIKSVIVIFENLVTWFKTNWPMIQTKFQEVMKGIESAYNTILKPVIDFMVAIFQQLIDWVVANWPLIQKTIETVLNAIWGIIKLVLNTIKDFWNTWGKTIMDYVSVCFNTIKLVITTIIHAVEDIIKAVMQAINGDWKGALNSLVQAVKDILGGLGAIIQNILNGIGKIFTDMVQVAYGWGKNLISGFIQGIESMAAAAAQAASNVVKSVSNFIGFHSPAKEGEGQHIVEWGANMISGFMGGIKSKLPDLQDLMKTAIKAPNLVSSVNMSVNGGSNTSNGTASSSASNSSNSNTTSAKAPAQNITINADFSGVSSKAEIEGAFKDMFGGLTSLAYQKIRER